MTAHESRPLSRNSLLEYFLRASTPRDEWKVGMELEKMGRRAADGKPLPHEGEGPSVRRVLEFIRARRGGDPVLEGNHLIGVDGPWGTISLEPGGQVEWSSRPAATLDELKSSLNGHLAVMREAEEALAIRWLGEAVDPSGSLEEACWMPKARYNIMRPYLGARGRLAHRMMTQTASIQCAFDYAGPEDWRTKFKAGALLAPVAVALFGNSSHIDGRDTGFHSYRQAIWRETDPDRCGLPAVVFDPTFDLGVWLDWILQVPTIFRHRARGLVPSGGVPFVQLMNRPSCDAAVAEDWETHISTIFTEVRSYSYIEVRCADLQPDDLAMAVPSFWTGLLYQDDTLRAALDLLADLDDAGAWNEAVDAAARHGLTGKIGPRRANDLAIEALRLSIRGLHGGAACAGDGSAASRSLERLAEHRGLDLS